MPSGLLKIGSNSESNMEEEGLNAHLKLSSDENECGSPEPDKGDIDNSSKNSDVSNTIFQKLGNFFKGSKSKGQNPSEKNIKESGDVNNQNSAESILVTGLRPRREKHRVENLREVTRARKSIGRSPSGSKNTPSSSSGNSVSSFGNSGTKSKIPLKSLSDLALSLKPKKRRRFKGGTYSLFLSKKKKCRPNAKSPRKDSKDDQRNSEDEEYDSEDESMSLTDSMMTLDSSHEDDVESMNFGEEVETANAGDLNLQYQDGDGNVNGPPETEDDQNAVCSPEMKTFDNDALASDLAVDSNETKDDVYSDPKDEQKDNKDITACDRVPEVEESETNKDEIEPNCDTVEDEDISKSENTSDCKPVVDTESSDENELISNPEANCSNECDASFESGDKYPIDEDPEANLTETGEKIEISDEDNEDNNEVSQHSDTNNVSDVDDQPEEMKIVSDVDDQLEEMKSVSDVDDQPEEMKIVSDVDDQPEEMKIVSDVDDQPEDIKNASDDDQPEAMKIVCTVDDLPDETKNVAPDCPSPTESAIKTIKNENEDGGENLVNKDSKLEIVSVNPMVALSEANKEKIEDGDKPIVKEKKPPIKLLLRPAFKSLLKAGSMNVKNESEKQEIVPANGVTDLSSSSVSSEFPHVQKDDSSDNKLPVNGISDDEFSNDLSNDPSRLSIAEDMEPEDAMLETDDSMPVLDENQNMPDSNKENNGEISLETSFLGQPKQQGGKSSIATSVKSRQRIKRKFMEDHIDVDNVSLSSSTSEPDNILAKRLKQGLDNVPSLNGSQGSPMLNGTSPLLGRQIPMQHGNGFLKKVTTCLCTSRSTVTSNKGIDKSVDGSPFCQAVDAMFGRIVACCNTVSKPQMHRPSVRIPFMYMCELHRHRLRLHQCCPGCGLFCTEGIVLQCRSQQKAIHHFHKRCLVLAGNKELCPHCGLNSQFVEVKLELNTPQPLNFYLSREPVTKL